MKTLNILIALHGSELINQVECGMLPKGSPAAPTNLGSYGTTDRFIADIMHSYHIHHHQIKSDDDILESELQWKIADYSDNSDYSAHLYNGVFDLKRHINNDAFEAETRVVYLPALNKFTDDNVKSNLELPTGRKLNSGLILQYTLSFVLLDNKKETIIGYFTWDPFITSNC